MIEYTVGVNLAWQIAAGEAAHRGHQFIEPEHLFIGLCKLGNLAEREDWARAGLPESQARSLRMEAESVAEVFASFQIDRVALYREVRRRTGRGGFQHGEHEVIHRSGQSREVFARAEELASETQSSVLGACHLLAALVEGPGSAIATPLQEKGVDVEAFRAEALIRSVPHVAAELAPAGAAGEARHAAAGSPGGDANSPGPTPFLDRYGADLVRRAHEAKIAPVIGDKAKREMLEVARILAQATKNNPVLVGEPGVGKTAVVEGLAWRLAHGKAPAPLHGKRIIQVSMGDLIAGTKYRGEFEARLQGILREAGRSPEVILFIDEIHTVVGAGAGGEALDAANIMKPPLSRGEVRCIGATTPSDYRKYIEKDPALERRFQPVRVAEPTPEEALTILRGRKARFEEHHHLTIADEAVGAAVHLSARYLPDRRLPDKAVDLLDKACVEVTVQWPSLIPGEAPSGKGEEMSHVTPEAVARVVSKWTGIPLAQLKAGERERLLGMAEELKRRVVGQDEACERIAQAVQRARAGLKPSGRPVGVLLFLGPTGVGKTELAKATAAFLFGSDRAVMRLDMSEFMEKHTASRLLGAPPGYIGSEEEGQLTGALCRTPHCLVLLDEIEKAHPEVLDLFLQVFDDGRLTDAKGRTADATQALFILTSNLPVEGDLAIGFHVRGDDVRKVLLKRGLRPELVNRLDEVVVFRRLAPDDLTRIAQQALEQIRARLEEQGMGLTWHETVPEYLSREGSSPEFGARELRRVIERRVNNEIAGMILREQARPGQVVALDIRNGALILDVREDETM